MHEDIAELTERAARGDAAAVETLLERYLGDLRAFVRLRSDARLRARESCSDLVQSVCREVLEHADRFRHPGEAAFKHWLFTEAERKIQKRAAYWTAQKREAGRQVDLPTAGDAQLAGIYDSFSTPSRRLMTREEVDRVEAAFDELEAADREVVTLAHVVGLSRAEIAERMQKSEGAVRVHLHRALARLAGRLQGEDA